MPDETRDIPTDQLVEPWVVLRLVNKESVEYLELRDSLADKGFFNSICVRPSPRQPDKYEVVDGLRRFTAARELRLPVVPCTVKHNLTDEDVLAAQIQANAVRLDTTPTEFARQLKRILSCKPGITIAQVATMVHKSPGWVRDKLRLLTLRGDIQKCVDRGEVPLESASWLARIPRVHQPQFVDMARVASVAEFRTTVGVFIKKYQEAVRQGKMDVLYDPDAAPVPHLRNVKELVAECQQPCAAPLVLAAENCRSPLDGWRLALQWALHLDAKSVEEQRRNIRLRLKTQTEEGLCSDEEP
jgi:ParB/RepB/Spo0J family partition protein